MLKTKKKILFQGRVPPPGNSVTADWLPSRGAVLPAVARRQPSPLSTRQTAGPHWRIQLVQCNLSFSQSVIKFKKCEFKKKNPVFFLFFFYRIMCWSRLQLGTIRWVGQQTAAAMKATLCRHPTRQSMKADQVKRKDPEHTQRLWLMYWLFSAHVSRELQRELIMLACSFGNKQCHRQAVAYISDWISSNKNRWVMSHVLSCRTAINLTNLKYRRSSRLRR